jgi:ankyrin repeat protein
VFLDALKETKSEMVTKLSNLPSNSYIKREIKCLGLQLLLLLGCCWACGKNYQPTETNNQTNQSTGTNKQPQAKVVNAELTEQLMGLLEAKSNDLEAIKSLLDSGADVNAKDKNSNTPLYLAIIAGNTEVVQTLLENRASINTKCSHDDTALLLATRKEEAKILDLLLKNGANVNAKNSNGNTLLHITLANQNSEIVKLLLKNRADANEKDGEGNTPLCIALRQIKDQKHCTKIVDLLLSNGAGAKGTVDPYDAPIRAIIDYRRDDLHKTVDTLLKAGADVDGEAGGWGNVLNYAIYKGLPHIVEVLLKNGADVNKKSNHYRNAFQIAIEGRKTRILDLLLSSSKSVDIQTPDDNGQTLLHWAIEWRSGADIIKSLLDNGAAVNAKDENGNTPLALALAKQNSEIVQLLQNHGAK